MPANCVCIQLGQCGIQVGHAFFNSLYEDYFKHEKEYYGSKHENKFISNSMPIFFNELSDGKHAARSVMVDMEPKAVNSTVQDAKTNLEWKYPNGQQLHRKSGSGNNWSYGYQEHGPKCSQEVMELVRKEIEKCDYFGGFVVLMSLAGGTGSGVGSYVLQKLHDLYPHANILNAAVLPYYAGEVAVQNYNSVLTLSSIISHADGSILIHNDHLHEICKISQGISKVSFKDLNKVAAHLLVTLLQPTSNFKSTSNIINDLLSATSCHSNYKFLTVKSVPNVVDSHLKFSTFTWQGLIKRMRQMHLTNFHVDEGMNWQVQLPSINVVKSKEYINKSIANLLVLRGEGSGVISANDTGFMDSRLYVPWIPPQQKCLIWSSSRPFKKYEKCVTFACNGSICINDLNRIVQKGWNMFSAKAYVHQYIKHGLDEEYFLNTFIKVENVLHSYATL